MDCKSPIPIENQRQVAALVMSSLCIFIAIVFVGLRLFAKFKMSNPFDASDACTLLALLFNTAIHADMFVMILAGGFSFHVQDIATRFGPACITTFFKSIMVFALIWNATTLFTKLSILFMYMSIFPTRTMILSCKILGALITVWNVAGVIAGLSICQPFAYNWDRTIEGGKCGEQPMYYMGLGVINIIIEVILITLPFPLVYKLQMPLRQKLVIVGLFSVGLGTIVITIYRQATLPYIEFSDMTHSGFVATVFACVEPSIALCIACAPFLRPYFRGAFPSGKLEYTPGIGGRPKAGMSESNARRFENLDDNASDVQLQPLNRVGEVRFPPALVKKG